MHGAEAAIARALDHARPQVLLADEPTGNLDRATGREILRILRTLNAQENLTIVMVTHDLAIAEEADRIVRLCEGGGRLKERRDPEGQSGLVVSFKRPAWAHVARALNRHRRTLGKGGHAAWHYTVGTPCKIYINGQLLAKEDAKISVYDHGLLYGDGVFEGLRSYGGRVFRLDEHIDRLYDSAKAIWLEIPIGKRTMADAVKQTLATNGLTDAYIRLVVTRGVARHPQGWTPIAPAIRR